MKKYLIVSLSVVLFLFMSGCSIVNRNTLGNDISNIISSKVQVTNFVPDTLKFNTSVNQNTATTIQSSQNLITLSTTTIYTKDNLTPVQSEGFKIISDNVNEIQTHLNNIYDFIENYLSKNTPLGTVVDKNRVAYILNKTDTGYSFYLNSKNAATPVYLEMTINNTGSENLIISARYEVSGVYTAYVEFSQNYIQEAYLLNNLSLSIGEYTKDSTGNTTIMYYRKNLLTNQNFYLTAFGNDTYGGITRHQYDDQFNTGSLYTEVYNSNANLVFQSYKYDSSVSSLGTEGARWFLNNVDGWQTVTDNQGTNNYNHNWTILGNDNQTYAINNTLTDNIFTRGYNIAYEPFTRVVKSNNALSLQQTSALVLIIIGNNQNDDALFTLPKPFSSDVANDVKTQTENLDTLYNTESLWSLPFKTMTYDQAVTLIPARNASAYPDASVNNPTTSTANQPMALLHNKEFFRGGL